MTKVIAVVDIGGHSLVHYGMNHVSGDNWHGTAGHHGTLLGWVSHPPTKWWVAATIGGSDAVRVNTVVLHPGTPIDVTLPDTNPTHTEATEKIGWLTEHGYLTVGPLWPTQGKVQALIDPAACPTSRQ